MQTLQVFETAKATADACVGAKPRTNHSQLSNMNSEVCWQSTACGCFRYAAPAKAMCCQELLRSPASMHSRDCQLLHSSCCYWSNAAESLEEQTLHRKCPLPTRHSAVQRCHCYSHALCQKRDGRGAPTHTSDAALRVRVQGLVIAQSPP